MTISVEMPAAGAALPVPAPAPALLQALAQRRSSSATTLTAPGPDRATLRALLQLASHAPDHGKLAPWRFIVLEGASKATLVARLEQLAATREDAGKATAALGKIRQPPLTVAVISRVIEGKIPAWEQELSAGAVCMNLLLAAHAAGFGANWITDWYAYDERATALLKLAPNERVAGFLHLGTQSEAPKERPRAVIDELMTDWNGDA